MSAMTTRRRERRKRRATGRSKVVALSDWADSMQMFDPFLYLVVDVEGFEPKVLRGMKLHLPRNQRRFPLFQFELGCNWAKYDIRHGNDTWTQET